MISDLAVVMVIGIEMIVVFRVFEVLLVTQFAVERLVHFVQHLC